MGDTSGKYYMSISLNVLKHMGLSLYSNTPAVLAEVVANAWDADASEVNIEFDKAKGVVSITDNGTGMDLEDVNKKYLYVGYQKRGTGGENQEEMRTALYKRRPMGRKGIGKLSLFAIAEKFEIHTRKDGGKAEAFEMDADKIRAAIDVEEPSQIGNYQPRPVPFKESLVRKYGTGIQITELKKLRLTRESIEGLRRRIARRFSILDKGNDFAVSVDGKGITLTDRDYFHKARYIYQYGRDYSNKCTKLATNKEGETIGAFDRCNRFNQKGEAKTRGKYEIKGWIAIAWHSNDLDGEGSKKEGKGKRKTVASERENLNKITIVVRGKVAQEDILQEFRLGGLITKYMFGEIEADFLDEDGKEDIATSSRQRIAEDDERYRMLARFIEKELETIRTDANQLKEQHGVEHALTSNPHLKEWYESIEPSNLKRFADTIFGRIDKAGIEEADRQQAYADGIILFEHLKINHTMDVLDRIDIGQVSVFLECLKAVDALEAEHYRKIVEGRLKIIQKLRDTTDEDVVEKILQEYVFKHLFLLDPGWERATEYADTERHLEKVLKDKKRIDIQFTKYRRVAAAHVVVELKRASVRVSKTELEEQVKGYMNALEEELKTNSEETRNLPIEGVCIVGKLPRGWSDERTRSVDEQSLALYRIRVMTYNELIENAFNTYGKFIQASESGHKLRTLIGKVGEFKPTEK